VRYQDLASLSPGEPSAAIRERVIRARAAQAARFSGSSRAGCNAGMKARDVHRWCRPSDGAQQRLKSAISEMHFSARAYDRILKVALTIADLEGSGDIGEAHVSEAIQFRMLDRRQWI